MNDIEKFKLEQERAKGEQYKRAYDNLVKPFIEAKNKELFEAFTIIPTNETDKLMMIKHQSNALRSLDDEFKSYITTGELASKSLNEEKSNG